MVRSKKDQRPKLKTKVRMVREFDHFCSCGMAMTVRSRSETFNSKGFRIDLVLDCVECRHSYYVSGPDIKHLKVNSCCTWRSGDFSLTSMNYYAGGQSQVRFEAYSGTITTPNGQ